MEALIRVSIGIYGETTLPMILTSWALLKYSSLYKYDIASR